MIYLDLGLRGGAITMLLLLALLMWRAPIGWEGRLSMVAVAFCQSAFLITQAAFPIELPPLVHSNLILLTALTPAAVTWFIVSIFLDGPRLRWPWALGATLASGGYYLELATEAGFPYCVAIGASLYGALVLLALWTARDDLVECRCRARPAFAVAIAGVAFAVTGAESVSFMKDPLIPLALLQSVGTLGVCLAFAMWLLRPEMNRWPGRTDPERAAPVASVASAGPDTALISRITTAMAAGIWREEGLTIGALAAKLAVPEHRLRRAINQGLGHRNFSSFINRARIEAACSMLQDPEHAHATMLEIAYDVGFSSMGPFNRAFRAEVGCSPTEYRQMTLSDTSADSGKSSSISGNLH